MRKRYRSRVQPPAEGATDPAGACPAGDGTRSITVKLDAQHWKTLLRCRRLLAGSEDGVYPTASHAVRLGLNVLFHQLTGHPPEGGRDGQS